MNPISYTGNNDKCVFHYKYSDIKEFIIEHRKSGAAGQILIKKDGNLLYYRCSGTIDNPIMSDKLYTFIYSWIEDLSGKFDAEKIINPTPAKWTNEFMIIPLNKKMSGFCSDRYKNL